MAKTGQLRQDKPHDHVQKRRSPYINGLNGITIDSSKVSEDDIFHRLIAITYGDKSTKSILSDKLLNHISKQIIEQTKRSGLFDEMRMKLLKRIESSDQFQLIKDKFQNEVDRFCFEADLEEPRSRLREQLNHHRLSGTSDLLHELVNEVSFHHRHRLKRLFSDQACSYISCSKRKLIEDKINQ